MSVFCFVGNSAIEQIMVTYVQFIRLGSIIVFHYWFWK